MPHRRLIIALVVRSLLAHSHRRNNWCGTHHWVGVSYDGGKTFNETTYDAVISGSNSYPYRVVVHPFNGSVAVITGYQGMPVVYTHDAGSTWGNATQANGTNAGQMLESVGWVPPVLDECDGDHAIAADGMTRRCRHVTSLASSPISCTRLLLP